jgi:predicted amidohydrolase YtcJ
MKSKTFFSFLVSAVCTPGLFASDLVLMNGHIYTANAKNEWAEALAVTGDKIDAVGSNADIGKNRTAKTKVIDLQGKTVIPGITDGHVHMWFGALALHGFNLSTPESNISTKDPELFAAKIKSYADSHPNEKIVFGRAQFITDYSPAGPSKPSVTHELLDKAVPNRPLVIHDTSEHALFVNQKALELAHISDSHLPDAALDKNVVRDSQGHPTGVLMEGAAEIMEQALPDPPLDQKLAWLAEAQHYLNRFGITTATMATGSLADVETFGKMRDRGMLTVRTRTAFGAVAVNHHWTPQFLADLEKARSNFHDSWVSANLVKFFSDGLSDPPLYTPADFNKLVLELDKRGFQIMTHSLGVDSAHMVLDAYQLAEKTDGPRDRRFRMEHADYLNPEDIPRFHQLSAIASMQPSFCCFASGLGKAKGDAWNSLLKSGAMVTFSSDWPCTWPPDPMVGMEQAVSRRMSYLVTPKGPIGPARYAEPEEKITIQQAVQAYTRDAAYANFADKTSGTLETGKFADLAVLSRDIFTAKPEEIGKTKVTMTMVAGKVVYQQ